MTYEGAVLPLDRANVDTDQIIPAHYLTGIDSAGLGKHLFMGMSGGPELLARHPDASVLVSRENFGCGSSREHAAWSLADRGFRAVIAPTFARIFHENAYNNGIAPIIVDASEIDGLLGARFVRVDLEGGVLTRDDGHEIHFELDPLRKQFLLSGGYMAFLASKRDMVREWVAART
ncbi:MAG: 3-isopropylmalate dehydratase small subunit [Candidatus Eremiobacteraeota bacterium]|nr:3-isopropylmalate dehydratase small subunit [Candidatus Eremiobacteraeota bacterium]